MLSQEEVARLIDATEFPFHRILLMTLYATGAGRAEVAHLKISDIDSRRLVIHFGAANATRNFETRCRAISSLAINPALMVLPNPTSSAKRITGRRRQKVTKLLIW